MATRPTSRTKGVTSSDGGVYIDALSTFMFSNAGAPTNGTSGTKAGRAGKGSLCIDRTNGKLYINTGTLASPTWTVVGSQS